MWQNTDPRFVECLTMCLSHLVNPGKPLDEQMVMDMEKIGDEWSMLWTGILCHIRITKTSTRGYRPFIKLLYDTKNTSNIMLLVKAILHLYLYSMCLPKYIHDCLGFHPDPKHGLVLLHNLRSSHQREDIGTLADIAFLYFKLIEYDRFGMVSWGEYTEICRARAGVVIFKWFQYQQRARSGLLTESIAQLLRLPLDMDISWLMFINFDDLYKTDLYGQSHRTNAMRAVCYKDTSLFTGDWVYFKKCPYVRYIILYVYGAFSWYNTEQLFNIELDLQRYKVCEVEYSKPSTFEFAFKSSTQDEILNLIIFAVQTYLEHDTSEYNTMRWKDRWCKAHAYFLNKEYDKCRQIASRVAFGTILIKKITNVDSLCQN